MTPGSNSSWFASDAPQIEPFSEEKAMIEINTPRRGRVDELGAAGSSSELLDRFHKSIP